MDFRGKLNEAEIKEAAKLVRPRGYNARMGFSAVRLVIYAGIVLFILYASVVQHRHIPPAVIITRVFILLLILGLFYFRYQRGTRQAIAQLDAGLPDTLTLEAEGVRLHGPNGAEGYQPWTSYQGFRAGQHVVLLDRREKGLYNVLAVSNLGPAERQQLLGLLGSHLPAETPKR